MQPEEPRIAKVGAEAASTRVYDGASEANGGARMDAAGHLPQSISRFEIRRRLGTGGFGDVYLAYDPTLGRELALKVPRGSTSWTGEETCCFLEEARNAARLKHPHVITVYDAGRADGNSVFIAMEYVAGESLAERLKRGPLSVAEAVRICGQVADAVHHGHKLGLVHRDLKPANILLERSGDAKVCDFGLSLHEDAQGERRGEVSGTRPYMSPEQLLGQAHRLDGRTDVWSLGVILYECLAGRRPFRGDTAVEVCDEILARDPKPLRQIDDALPAELDALCRQALERDLSRRLSTAADFRQALLSIGAPPRANAKRTWLAVAGIGCVLAAAALAIAAFSLRPGEQKTDRGGGLDAGRLLSPGRIDLLRQAPQPVIFSDGDVDSNYSFAESTRRLFVSSRRWSMFACGSHPDEFSLDVVARQDPPGITGVFWGLHPQPTAAGTTENSCLVASLKPDAEASDRAVVSLHSFTIAKNALGFPDIIATAAINSTAVDVDWSNPIDFKLHVRAGRPYELTIQGVRAHFPEKQSPIDWEEFVEGQCGLVASDEDVVFTRALLESHRQGQTQ